MDLTPGRPNRMDGSQVDCLLEEKENNVQGPKLKKPPPITPRRFNRFFTPRPRNAAVTVKTSRAALKLLSGSSVNRRSSQPVPSELPQNVGTPRGKKRKLSFVTNESVQSSPATKVGFLSSSQEIRSSPTIPERRSPSRWVFQNDEILDEDEAETDLEMEDDSEEDPQPSQRILPYRYKTTSGGLLSARVNGRRIRYEAASSDLWQQQTSNFYSSPLDVNSCFSNQPAALPFSVATCHTNPIIATGDEEGTIRIIDSGADNEAGLTKTFFQMTPHDNALMDLEFSQDDAYLATACGDQSCQIIDMHTQTSLYTLGGHRCSVKRISFQPGSSNNILASCGRDGQLNFWDLRCDNTTNYAIARKANTHNTMTVNMKQIMPTHGIREAHTAGAKSAKAANAKVRPNLVPGRADFSVTSLSFLGESRPHLLATASEIDTTVKVWDIRTQQSHSRRAPVPLSCTEQPRSHAFHRCFGVTSLVVNTDGSKMYALSRDHTVYAYSTAHMILGSSPQLSSNSKPSKLTDSTLQGLGPLYGFRHPSLKVQTFWPRLAIRRETDTTPELLAIGSTEDCAVLFPTDERYLTKSNTKIPPRHIPSEKHTSTTTSRPALARSLSSSFNSSFSRFDDDEQLPIYYHGTPLIRGHDKEVTSVAWNSEGSLLTASDDYTIRCWREDPTNARRMRDKDEKNGERWKRGWADVGLNGFDDEF